MALRWDFLGIPNLGIGDGDFSFWVRSKNPRGFEISWMGIGDLESQKSRVKNPPKIPNAGNEDLGFLRLENPKNIPNFYIPGIGDFLSPGFSGDGDSFFVGWDIPPKSHHLTY